MKLITNLITTSRIFLTIILMCLYNNISNYLFLILIAGIFSTDFIDGKLARKYHVETFYGSLMDTAADKVLNVALILPLLAITNLFWILLGCEVAILVINTIGTIKGKKTRTLFLGKVKMWFVFLSIILGYANVFNYISKIYVIISLLVTILCELIVIIDYIIFLLKQRKNPSPFKVKNINDLIYFLFNTEYYKESMAKKIEK